MLKWIMDLVFDRDGGRRQFAEECRKLDEEALRRPVRKIGRPFFKEESGSGPH